MGAEVSRFFSQSCHTRGNRLPTPLDSGYGCCTIGVSNQALIATQGIQPHGKEGYTMAVQFQGLALRPPTCCCPGRASIPPPGRAGLRPAYLRARLVGGDRPGGGGRPLHPAADSPRMLSGGERHPHSRHSSGHGGIPAGEHPDPGGDGGHDPHGAVHGLRGPGGSGVRRGPGAVRLCPRQQNPGPPHGGDHRPADSAPAAHPRRRAPGDQPHPAAHGRSPANGGGAALRRPGGAAAPV